MARLVFLTPGFENQSCELAEGVTRVGRGPQNALVIQDASVSADHCEILVFGPEIIVREHHSTNGTWVAGKRVAAQSQIRHGEIVRFGKIEARLELPPPTDDLTTENTAMLDYRRVLHAQQHPGPVAADHAVMHPVGTDQPPPDATMLLTKDSIPPAPVSSPAPQIAPPDAEAKSQLGKWILAGVIALALAFAWFWWRSR